MLFSSVSRRVLRLNYACTSLALLVARCYHSAARWMRLSPATEHASLVAREIQLGPRHQSSCKGLCQSSFRRDASWFPAAACPLDTRGAANAMPKGRRLATTDRSIRTLRYRRNRCPTNSAAAKLHLERRQPDVARGRQLRDRHGSNSGQLHQFILVSTILHGAPQHIYHCLRLIEGRGQLQFELRQSH